MSVPSRDAKVFAVLLASMIVTAAVLMALGNNPPSAGAFCLTRYYGLDPVDELITSQVAQNPGRWSNIEVYYSPAHAGDVEQSDSSGAPAEPENIHYHFVVWNGQSGSDGEIQPTERWQSQKPAAQYDSTQTIRICILADGNTAGPTEFQIKRTEALVDALSRHFDIAPGLISYPQDWHWPQSAAGRTGRTAGAYRT